MPVTVIDRVAVNAVFELAAFTDRRELGTMLSGAAFVRTTHKTIRVADAAYWRKQFPIPPDSSALIPTPPDLVIEVRRTTDTWLMRVTRAVEYLRAGVPVVVILDVPTGSVVVYRPDQRPQIAEKDETLTIPDVLPGFEVPVARFFEE